MRLLYSLIFKVRPASLADLIKSTLGISRQVISTSNGVFWVDPISMFGLAVASDHGYEPEWTQEIKRTVNVSSTFVDVGANEGYYTIIAAKNGAKVLAIEPQRRLLSVIEKNLKLNDVSATVVNCAVSSRRGIGEIFLSSGVNPGSSGFTRMTRYNLPKEAVQTEALSDILDDNGFDSVDVMKMDIEGAEYDAILGSQKLFKEGRIKSLLLEMHPAQIASHGKDAGDIERFLRGCGYEQVGATWRLR